MSNIGCNSRVLVENTSHALRNMRTICEGSTNLSNFLALCCYMHPDSQRSPNDQTYMFPDANS